jgi:SAM-dependent methyltransferase
MSDRGEVHEKNPVDKVEFWRDRIYRTFATGGMLHQCVLDDSYDLWQWIQDEYAGLMLSYVKPGDRVLDAGCGYGALLCCFQQAKLIDRINYLGIDFSPDLIELARYRYPGRDFAVMDLSWLPLPSNTFDWCILRSVDGMIRNSVSEEAWQPMHAECRRVAKRLFLGGYPTKVGEPVPFEVEECS